MENEKAHLAVQIQVWEHEIQDGTLVTIRQASLAFILLTLSGNFVDRYLLYKM